jgi:3-hydroxyacyl-CoA dehydrogenase/enoyl-CoA hydratase/3-hydroxybutyryl-CoA epimerase
VTDNRTTHITAAIDGDGIATLTMDWPGTVNLMDADFLPSITAAVDDIERGDVKGAILRSAKRTFFAGADVARFAAAQHASAKDIFQELEGWKAQLRRIETLGKPVVALIEGAAVGGGFEISLACHHRIAVDDDRTKIGLPEVQLGLLPAAGGVTRLVRMLGLQAALPLLLEAKMLSPTSAAAMNLVELAKDAADAEAKARAFIAANPKPAQLWDSKGYKIPGGQPFVAPSVMQLQIAAPAMLTAKTLRNLPAPEAILAVAVEGAQVDFDTALRIETRYFVKLLKSPIAHNLIGTLYTDLNALKSGAARPTDVPNRAVRTLGVLGAGMMGAGIGYAAAMKGIAVMLIDTDQQRADKGKAYSDQNLSKRVARGVMDEAGKQAVMDRITATTDFAALQDADLIIEAVFEDPQIKADVTRRAEPYLVQGGIFASNTSTIPITDLAKASLQPDRFIGLHFFSPVDKMQLVEIIRGRGTSEDTVSHAIDFVLQIGKVPITVNDARGFFTSRVFGQYINEGAAMVAEGVPPAMIENVARQAGMPVGPLAVLDEVTLTLPLHIEKAARASGAISSNDRHPGMLVLERLVTEGRTGRAGGKGFYDYPVGREKHLSPELAGCFPVAKVRPDPAELRDRLLYAQAVDALRVMADGTLESPRELNVGSILGIGFPAWTGGVHRFVDQIGRDAFVVRANELADRHGERFRVPANW